MGVVKRTCGGSKGKASLGRWQQQQQQTGQDVHGYGRVGELMALKVDSILSSDTSGEAGLSTADLRRLPRPACQLCMDTTAHAAVLWFLLPPPTAAVLLLPEPKPSSSSFPNRPLT